jgi:hypothetical protein
MLILLRAFIVLLALTSHVHAGQTERHGGSDGSASVPEAVLVYEQGLPEAAVSIPKLPGRSIGKPMSFGDLSGREQAMVREASNLLATFEQAKQRLKSYGEQKDPEPQPLSCSLEASHIWCSHGNAFCFLAWGDEITAACGTGVQVPNPFN